jgi:hypothetical protein
MARESGLFCLGPTCFTREQISQAFYATAGIIACSYNASHVVNFNDCPNAIRPNESPKDYVVR